MPERRELLSIFVRIGAISWCILFRSLGEISTRPETLLLLTFCLLLLPLWESVIVLCFVVRYFMSILVLQSSWWGRESWLLCLICLPGVSWWLSGSSSRCHGVVCGLWLWYFLIILTYYFCWYKGFWGDFLCLISCLWSIISRLEFTCWISSVQVFSCMYCWVLNFVLSFHILICLY